LGLERVITLLLFDCMTAEASGSDEARALHERHPLRTRRPRTTLGVRAN